MINSDAAPAVRILIVDDDPIVRSLMRAALEGDGHEVVEAADGEAAVGVYERQRPRLLIADVVMPSMDGFALCRELRRRPESAYLPILMAPGSTTCRRSRRPTKPARPISSQSRSTGPFSATGCAICCGRARLLTNCA